jgi:glycosyltransferase involved in cell wall biosynthesis
VQKCQRDSYDKDDYYCFIGRLSHEKGAKTLIEAANKLPYRLVVIGGGPLMEDLKAITKSNIEFVGFKQWEEIKELVGKAKFSVIPSEWYENNPLSVIEAKCLGTPVLGARIGGIPELIEEGATGMTFESRNVDDLKDKIQKMWNTSWDYEKIAHQSQERYNAEKYYEEIMKIYKS